MKVGVVLISNQYFGAEKAVFKISKELALLGQEVHLFVNRELSSFIQPSERLFIHPIGNLNTKSKLMFEFSLLRNSMSLDKEISKISLDIVHLHMDSSIRAYSRLYNKFKIPFVVTFHGSDIFNFIYLKNIIYTYFIRSTIELMLNKASALTVVNPSDLLLLKSSLRFKSFSIPNGVDLSVFRAAKPKNIPGYILFVGRYIELKGINEILDIVSCFPKQKFVFVGSGPLKSKINFENTVDMGYIDSVKLVDVYNDARICIFPSHREGFPLVGLEAMACGKAVIATNIGFSNYIINNINGILISPRDSVALKSAIERLLVDSVFCEKLGVEAQKSARNYSWSNAAKKYLELFRNTISFS